MQTENPALQLAHKIIQLIIKPIAILDFQSPESPGSFYFLRFKLLPPFPQLNLISAIWGISMETPFTGPSLMPCEQWLRRVYMGSSCVFLWRINISNYELQAPLRQKKTKPLTHMHWFPLMPPLSRRWIGQIRYPPQKCCMLKKNSPQGCSQRKNCRRG